MNDISSIDSNFKVETKLNINGLKFYNIKQEPFGIYGVFYESGKFRRIPESVAKNVNDGVYSLHANTAGGRVRFRTNSPYVAIHAKMPSVGKMPHFALSGSAGFDLYADDKYTATFMPPFNIEDGYESVVHFDCAEMRELTINFPLYSDVAELYIGVSDTAHICEPEPYKIKKPVVYYGSSITQGGCASRPGNSYQSIISRRFDADYINLGFSGSARGEDEIAQYISNLDMSVFVYDYDHNAPTTAHLQNTHAKMFELIRKAHPDIPVVFMSRPKYYLTEDEEQRLEIIKETYNNALQNGDNNVYLLDGRKLTELAGNDGTVDNCHPNDLGFMSMAKAVGDILEQIFGK